MLLIISKLVRSETREGRWGEDYYSGRMLPYEYSESLKWTIRRC